MVLLGILGPRLVLLEYLGQQIDAQPRAVGQVQMALPHVERLVDVGEIACICDGKPLRRYFVNVAGLGFDGEVAIRVNRMSKRISGTLPYLTRLVLTLVSYRNKDVRLTMDGREWAERVYAVMICNAQYLGGGMWMAPEAEADDGLFDVVVLGDMGKLEFLANVPRVYKGTHVDHPKTTAYRAREVHVEAEQPMHIQAEGEIIGEAPATFRVLPRALCLRV